MKKDVMDFSLMWVITVVLFFCSITAQAQTLKRVTLDASTRYGQVLTFHFSDPIKAVPRHFKTLKPSQLILDFNTVTSTVDKSGLPISNGTFRKVELLQKNERLRAVIALNTTANQRMEINENKLLVMPYANAIPEGPLSRAPKHTTKFVHQIDFHRMHNGGGQLSVQLGNPNIAAEIKARNQKMIIFFRDTQIPARLQRILDVNDFATPVSQIRSSMDGADAKILLQNKKEYNYYAYQIDRKFMVDILPATMAHKTGHILSSRHQYTGEKISLNFQDIKIRAVLQLLSQFTGINIVASDSIKNSITLHLYRVPWDQVLDIIIRTQGLTKKQMGNVILIAPIEEMAARDKQELQASQEVSALSPIVSELIPVRYANAAEISTLLKGEKNSLLSSRGQLSTDARTNTLWVQDTAEKIAEIQSMLQKLDRPVKQVLIEARIVDVNRDYEKNLGIRFGVSKAPHVSGTLAGANKIANGSSTVGGVPFPERLNMDFPALPSSGSRPITLGVALANLGKGYLLDLELSALEEEGKGTVISSPRLVTTDQRTARIESGEEIPYQESTSSGATNVSFKKAVLSLQVTPHITPDNKLVMDLDIHQDTRGPVVSNVPSILTKQIQTRVLVDNGETIVLGGIYESTDQKGISRVPLLGSIPVLGRFFRNGQDFSKRSELIIFITPKIIDSTMQEELDS